MAQHRGVQPAAQALWATVDKLLRSCMDPALEEFSSQNCPLLSGAPLDPCLEADGPWLLIGTLEDVKTGLYLLPLGEQSQKAKGNTELVGSARGSDTLEVSRELPGVPCSAPVSLPRSHAVPPASWERAAWSSEEGPLGRDRTHPYRGPPRAQEAQGPGDWRGRDGPGAGEGCELPQYPHPRAGSRGDLILGNPTGSCSSSMASPSARWEVLGDCAPWTRLRGSASPDAGCPRSMLASRQHVWASPSGDKNTCLVSFLGTLGRCRAGEH